MNKAKNISFNLGFINKYLFYHPYVTIMPIECELEFGTKYDILPESTVLNYLRKYFLLT